MCSVSDLFDRTNKNKHEEILYIIYKKIRKKLEMLNTKMNVCGFNQSLPSICLIGNKDNFKFYEHFELNCFFFFFQFKFCLFELVLKKGDL